MSWLGSLDRIRQRSASAAAELLELEPGQLWERTTDHGMGRTYTRTFLLVSSPALNEGGWLRVDAWSFELSRVVSLNPLRMLNDEQWEQLG